MNIPSTIQEVAKHLEAIAPPEYQEAYDNVGLIVGDPTANLQGILVTLDITEAVIAEAITKQCNLIVAHHPPIFRPLKRLVHPDITTRAITKAIQHQIALYAIHTNLDHMPHGVNKTLAERIGLQNPIILAPLPHADPNENIGAGMIASLPTPHSVPAFLDHLKHSLNLPCIRYTPYTQPIQRVAICGGAGFPLLTQAKAQQADAFITADIKYHQFFEADQQLLLADIGHYESEVGTKKLLYQLLSDKFPNIALLESTLSTNPISYHV